MEFKDFLTKAAHVWLENQGPGYDARSGGVKTELTDRDIEDFLSAAERREDPLWHEIEVLLTNITILYPLRAPRLKKEIKWLRKEAKKKGLKWGK